jgi:hypothetical protein
LIAGSRELDEGKVQIKDLVNKVSTEVAWKSDHAGLVESLKTILRLSQGNLLA